MKYKEKSVFCFIYYKQMTVSLKITIKTYFGVAKITINRITLHTLQ